MEHLEVDLPATEASEEEVERNNVEEDVAGDKVERGVKSVKPIGAEIWAGKVLELVLEVASRQIRLAPAWVWRELCKIFDRQKQTISSFTETESLTAISTSVHNNVVASILQ